jgi:hypothetical protein
MTATIVSPPATIGMLLDCGSGAPEAMAWLLAR